jgi:membrane protease subunit HflC
LCPLIVISRSARILKEKVPDSGIVMRTALLFVLTVAVVIVAWMSVFTVDPTEFVYVTQFGRHIATFDGSLTDTDAGLHWRWPWPIQSVRRLDRRLQHFDLPAIELLTRDAGGADKSGGSSVDKTLTVEAYVCWRIDKGADHVDRFVRRIDNPARARDILGQRVNSELGALIGQMHMDDLITTEVVQLKPNGESLGARTKVDDTMAQLRAKVHANLQKPVLDEYGIEIVDVRLKRFNHPIKVRETIFGRIISERELKAAAYKNEGKKRADDIRSAADAKVEMLSKEAEKVEKERKREAEAEAALILAAAFRQDAGFFRFWQEMEQMKSILGNSKTTLLLSTHRGVFDFLFNAPGPDGSHVAPRPEPVDGSLNRTGTAPGKEDRE